MITFGLIDSKGCLCPFKVNEGKSIQVPLLSSYFPPPDVQQIL